MWQNTEQELSNLTKGRMEKPEFGTGSGAGNGNGTGTGTGT